MVWFSLSPVTRNILSVENNKIPGRTILFSEEPYLPDYYEIYTMPI